MQDADWRVVGHVAAIQLLEQHICAGSDPGLRIAVVDGAAGAGKTLLLQALAVRLAAAGIDVLSPSPLGPPATPVTVGPSGAEPLVDILSRAAVDHPCALVIDDLDSAAIEVLTATELVTTELDDHDVALVVALSGSALPPPAAQTVSALVAARALTVRLAVARTPGAGSQPDEPLDPGLRDVLRVGAILGRSFDPGDLATAVDRPVPLLAGDLARATTAGVLAAEGTNRVAFCDGTFAGALLAEVPEAALLSLRRHVARRLAAAGRHPAVWARDLASTAEPADAALLSQAARDIVAHAPADAVLLLERSLDVMPADGAERGRVLGDLVTALAWSNRQVDAVTLAKRSLPALATPAARGHVVVALARAMTLTGSIGPALLDAVTAERDHVTPDARAHLDAIAARVVAADDPLGARRLAWPLRRTERGSVVGVLAAIALSTAAERDLRVAHAVRWGRVALGESADLHPAEGHFDAPAQLALGVALVQADEFEEARAVLHDGLRLSTSFGLEAHVVAYHGWLGRLAYHEGAWDDAVAEIETGLRMLRTLRAGGHFDHSMLVRIAVARDQPAKAVRSLGALVDSAARAGIRVESSWANLLVAGQTDPAAVAPIAQRVLEDRLERGVLGAFRSAPDSIDIARRAGHEGLARAAIALTEAAAAAAKTPSAQGAALHIQGAWEHDVDALSEAVRILRATPRRDDLAAALADLARAAAAVGDREVAVRTADEVLGSYDAWRAAMLRRRLVEDLAAHGVRPNARRSAPRRADQLTPTEELVVAEVARGLSNPEIGQVLGISPRTVATHLTHVFQKLGIRSRSQLAALAATKVGWADAALSQPGPG